MRKLTKWFSVIYSVLIFPLYFGFLFFPSSVLDSEQTNQIFYAHIVLSLVILILSLIDIFKKPHSGWVIAALILSLLSFLIMLGVYLWSAYLVANIFRLM